MLQAVSDQKRYIEHIHMRYLLYGDFRTILYMLAESLM